MTKLWRVAGRADVYFFVRAETEEEALDKAQDLEYERLEHENIEAFYEEAFEVEEDD